MHRPGSRHRNADARPGDLFIENESADKQQICGAVKTSRKNADVPHNVGKEGQTSTGESIACLQQQDSYIGPILRLRLRQTNQPSPEEVAAESEAVKVLWGQWRNLVLKDGVLYRKAGGKNGRPSILQLIVPATRRMEFTSRCHQGMTGGHRAFQSTLDQVQRRGFWFGWRRDVQRYCRQCQSCSTYHRGRLPRCGPFSR